jgi:cell division protein FtsB
VRLLIAVLIILLVVLQYKLWMGQGGYFDVRQLEQELVAQRSNNEKLLERNRALQAEVEDLKKGLAAIEERAREELGMIREGETFYQVVPRPDDQKKPSTRQQQSP